MLSQPPPQLLVPTFFPHQRHLKQHAPADYASSSPDPAPPSPRPLQPPPPPFQFAAGLHYSPQPPSSNHFSSAADAPEQASYDINSPRRPTNTDPAMNSYLDESPSPVDPQCSLSALPQAITVSHCQERFLHSDTHPYPAEDPVHSHPESADNHTSRQPSPDKYSTANNLHISLLDQRRMSEPTILSGPALFPPHPDPSMSSRYQQQQFGFPYGASSLHASRSSGPLYGSSLHRGASTGSLRDLRHHHFEFPPQQQHEWKHDDSRQRDHPQLEYYDHRTTDTLDEPISPMQNTFAHGLLASPTSALPYSPISDNLYGPSPPGTGTSTSSSVAPMSNGLPTSPSRSISQHLHRSLSASQIPSDSLDRKTYSFVALPGNAVKKRPRRRYDEIERLYVCSWPDCNKSYGTLNHLNAHVTMQKHGSKRSPNEFKELRKQWRKAKKEQEVAAAAMRRSSFSDGYDDHHGYSHRYLGHYGMPQRHLASSVTIGTAERYSVAVDDIRYPQEHEDTLGVYEAGTMSARQRYTNSQAASWHDGSQLSRAHGAPPQQSFNDQAIESSSSLPTYPHQHTHHSELPQLDMGNGGLLPHPSTVPEPRPRALVQQALDGGAHPSGRLPQNSTLLTPLPGYPAPALLTPMHGAVGGGMAFGMSAEGYDLYETDIDNGSRPGTGHASLGGHASADEYSQ